MPVAGPDSAFARCLPPALALRPVPATGTAARWVARTRKKTTRDRVNPIDALVRQWSVLTNEHPRGSTVAMSRRTAHLSFSLAVAAALSLAACSAEEGDASPAPATAGAGETSPAAPASSPQASEPGEAEGATSSLPEQTVGQTPDCTPWSLESVGAIFGVPLTDTDEGQVIELTAAGGVRYSCDFNETDSGLGLTVVIDVAQYPSEEEAVASISNTRSAATFGDTVYFVIEDVSGLGDEAFFSLDPDDEGKPNPMQVQLYARQGETVFLLTALNLDGLADGQAAKDDLIETLSVAIS